ncbi:MAG: hypothetical protein D3914_06795 [Candidatus Electrothrix sp. LOE2]|nr:hypothetical protein [Candidatus Electrothrix sp. LOE2]
MKKILNFIGVLTVFSCIVGGLFYADSFALDKTTRYRPLANGWVSYHAAMYLRGEGSFIDKFKKAVSDDLIHGRFRPAFTFYVSSPYALSPIIHKRNMEAEGRPYDRLLNGDLLLFSFILLGSVALSIFFMSLLIYKYTNEIVFAFIPAFFIPLSSSLTENLLQNYIDSQEIPLVLWLSTAIFFLFMAVSKDKRSWRILFIFLSSFFFILSFLTKETTVVLSVALISLVVLVYFYSIIVPEKKLDEAIVPFVVSALLAVVCSVIVYCIVSMNRRGYAADYSLLNITDIKNALALLWVCFSKYSLNNLYGYIPILCFATIAIKERKKSLNGLSMIKHLSLLVFLLLLCCGFFLILVPWRPILIKYLFPSNFFLFFAVALSLSLLAVWAKERYGKKGYLFYFVLLAYAAPYKTYYASAHWERTYLADQAGYGVSVVDRLSESIDREVKQNVKSNQSILVEYGADVDWADNIPWAKLHLMRILNLDKGINLIDSDGNRIWNYQMPKAEATSFKEYQNGRMLYLSNNPKELATTRFDVVYKGYTMKERPEPEFTAGSGRACYKITDERIDWQGRSGAFPGFSLYLYHPVDCQREHAANKEEKGHGLIR